MNNPNETEKSKPTVLLSGAAGHAGQGMTLALRKSFRVRGLDIERTAGCDEMTVGSVTDLEFCKRAMAGVDAVVIAHMGRNPVAYQPPFLGIDTNVRGAGILFQAAFESGIRRVVLISSTSVLGPGMKGSTAPAELHYVSSGVYALTKIMQEILACHFFEQHGIVTTVLRPKWIVRESDFQTKYGNLDEEYNPGLIDPLDVGEAAACALKRPTDKLEAFTIGQPGFSDVSFTTKVLGWSARHTFESLKPTFANGQQERPSIHLISSSSD